MGAHDQMHDERGDDHDHAEEPATNEEAVSSTWGQLFTKDLSYFSGHTPVSLIVVLALLSSIMIYAVFHCYVKNKNMDKLVEDETKPLITIAETDIRIV